MTFSRFHSDTAVSSSCPAGFYSVDVYSANQGIPVWGYIISTAEFTNLRATEFCDLCFSEFQHGEKNNTKVSADNLYQV